MPFLRFNQPDSTEDPSTQPCTTAPQQSDNQEDRPPASYSTQDLLPNTLADRNVRKTFILRVCLLLGVQCILISSFVVGFFFIRDSEIFHKSISWIVLILTVVSGISSLILIIFQKIRRTHPWNLILLSIENLSFAPVAGVIVSFFDTVLGLISLGITAAICIAVIIFSIKAPYDITLSARVQTASVIGFFLFLILAFVLQNFFLSLALAFLTAPLFTWAMAVNIQMCLGNKTRTFSRDDYIWADLLLYRCFMIIFFSISLISHWLGLMHTPP